MWLARANGQLAMIPNDNKYPTHVYATLGELQAEIAICSGSGDRWHQLQVLTYAGVMHFSSLRPLQVVELTIPTAEEMAKAIACNTFDLSYDTLSEVVENTWSRGKIAPVAMQPGQYRYMHKHRAAMRQMMHRWGCKADPEWMQIVRRFIIRNRSITLRRRPARA
jgi:hypothetical protein